MSSGIRGPFLSHLAKELADSHKADISGRVRHPDVNAKVSRLNDRVQNVYRALAGKQAQELGNLPGNEWLLDNEYVILEALQQIETDLPWKFYRQLPLIDHQDSGAMPRAESLVRATVDANDVPLVVSSLEQFVAAYQETHVLKLGELWALPALLRLVILEKLCDAAEQQVGISADVSEPCLECGDILAGCILTLNAIAHAKWRDCIERLSVVNGILLRDPAQAYAAMDFKTRDSYRHRVEELARQCRCTEINVAENALYLASTAQENIGPQQHLGYFLIGPGQPALQRQLGFKPTWVGRLLTLARRRAALVYVIGIGGSSFGLLALLFGWLQTLISLNAALALTVISAPAALGLCSGILNAIITRCRAPKMLPKMDFKKGIDSPWKTAVAVPVLLTGAEELDHILHNIETNYLGNNDRQLQYVLLTDFPDAAEPELPGESALLELASRRIDELNERNTRHGIRPFHLMHRRRLWNESESCWMGWERKRGKLSEFNQFLLQGQEGTFSHNHGDHHNLKNIKLVICLDADTHLTAGSARRLVSVLAHPLNRPAFDPDSGRVTSGYTIIQPRVEINPVGANSTLFSRIFTGDVTFDLYTHAVSNVYQDMLSEGIFVGKGIYDLQGFATSVEGQIPENSILSHDLLEGMHGRAALASDIVLFEEFPTTLLAYVRRQHRWIRGDWQLCPWLGWSGARVGAHRARFRSRLIDRWKLLDNIARSLLHPSLLVLLVGGWLLLPRQVWLWTAGVVLIPGLPILVEILAALAPANWRWATIGATLAAHGKTITIEVARWVLIIAFLPFQSLVALDAIIRTLFRLLIRRKHLLEWTSAAQVARQFGFEINMLNTFGQMYPAVLLALVIGALVWSLAPAASFITLPFVAVWLSVPLVGWWVSQPYRSITLPLTANDKASLRLLARRTWHFFESFMNPENQWLAPDNIQQVPKFVIAQRTSPSNIGFSMLSILSAYDFGYLSLNDLCPRLTNTLQTLRRIPQHRGHFLNWIKTTDLSPLDPHYISTVDSGNLAGCLIALIQGLKELPDNPAPSPQLRQGIHDTFGVLFNSLERVESIGHGGDLGALLAALRKFEALVSDDSDSWQTQLVMLDSCGCQQIEDEFLAALKQPDAHWSAEDIAEFRGWIRCLNQEIRAAKREQQQLAPWLEQLEQIPAIYQRGDALGQEFEKLITWLQKPLTLSEIAHVDQHTLAIRERIDELMDDPIVGAKQQEAIGWTIKLKDNLQYAEHQARSVLADVAKLVTEFDRIVDGMDFRFLYDPQRNLFHIGYNASSGELDSSYYDLLASEARLASFIAIAQRQVPVEHWLHLGRPLTRIGGTRVLLSWSATLFEYLMPNLLMECPERTLLSQSCRHAVNQAQLYGRQNGTPWGISESGYYRFDPNGNYQYRAFGLPQLGLSRTHDQRLVISPYASVLALPYARSAVVTNLEALRKNGMEDQFGMREALDYGPTANYRPDLAGKVVGSYMSHHQGMIMLALGNALLDNPMVRRFHADPRIASIKPLLYEALPNLSPTINAHQYQLEAADETPHPQLSEIWKADVEQTSINILSNSHLNTRISSQGGGGQYWNDIALTRWDSRTNGSLGGLNLYFHDTHSDASWSLGATQTPPHELTVNFGPHLATFLLRKQELLTHMSITVAPDADVEIRKVVISNESDRSRSIFISFAGEPVMTRYEEFRRHPTFSRLFIESKFIADSSILIFRRRPRDAGQEKLYVGYALIKDDLNECHVVCENDRSTFLGRRGDHQDPAAISGSAPTLTGAASGDTPNPWMALGTTVDILPRDSVHLTFLTAVGNSQRRVLEQIGQFDSQARIVRSIKQAQEHNDYDLQQAGLEPGDPHLAMKILARVFWPEPAVAEKRNALYACTEAQQSMWRQGISGDNPIVVMRLSESGELGSAAQLLRCHTHWNLRGVAVDLVFLDEASPGYSQPARDRLRNLIEKSQEHHLPFKGMTVIIPASSLNQQDRNNLLALASVYLPPDTNINMLLQQRREHTRLPPFVPVPSARLLEMHTEPLPQPEGLLLENGYGGFSKDGREYVMYQTPDRIPPAPWTNILANPNFGCLTSSSGLEFTWADNSSEYRLTRWHNDPVTEESGEALYLRDEETAAVWSPTPLPAGDDMPYQVAHGAGYTRFEHNSNGLNQRVTVFADPEEPVKIIQIELKNLWPRGRRLTATYAVEWILGNSEADNAGLLIPEFDGDTHAILVRNGFARHHAARMGFLAASVAPHGFTADLDEFLGANRSWRDPAGLHAIGLSDRRTVGRAICGAYQVHVDLAESGTSQFHFILGAGENRKDAIQRIQQFQNPEYIMERNAALAEHWDELLGQLQIATPDPAIDLLTNRWLLYQVISSRLWGRTGFYQPGGAFGFRDQLQDVLALLMTQPTLALEQILRSAAVQFEEGDVLHWWHTSPLRGVRTRCSDDLLWLPYAVAEYLQATGDTDLLNQQVAWLDGEPLEPAQSERYAEFMPSNRSASIYAHCCRAIDARLKVGAHGLPLIGTGDWNDGLNRVGADGEGESLWMAWFLCFVIDRFAPICAQRGDAERANHYRQRSTELAHAANANGWDGEWYLRGFYDDGDPLGSKASKECRIDLNAQTWASISGAGEPEKLQAAMQSVQQELIDPDHQLIKLLAPPFQKSIKDPGYIKGYAPGMRENGGQYNHAAVWAVWAAANMGNAEQALQWCQWMNPIYRTANQEAANQYRIEPYVMAGDISAGGVNKGRGGWSWYSGSAAWYYRLIAERLLGLQWSFEGFRIAPCLPSHWLEFSLHFRHGETTYTVSVEQPGSIHDGNVEIVIDGNKLAGDLIAWAHDEREHIITVRPRQDEAEYDEPAAADKMLIGSDPGII